MSDIQTFEGWTSFETGHLTPQYDQNFVVYTETNNIGSGINCKIRIHDLVQSDVAQYLSRGGMCRVIVRGIMRIAPITEQGWVPTSTRFLQVTWIMREQQPEVFEEGMISHQEKKIQQRQSYSISTNNRNSSDDADSEDITEEKEPQSQDEDDNESDPDYSSIDVEEEERKRMKDTDFDDDEASSEDVEKLKAEGKELLNTENKRKRDDEDSTEDISNKKRKENSPNSSRRSSNVIALE
ncbi:hypothetical protein INT45_006420 [Circinella minor]|uniref:Uncharacterized protein n=1 Tax=Circinella minor TaxID=1195481 RepID=A0A8H7SEJ9_9FUNG|nr:hypothetical protein INT45_006420 [Circinella minor]